MKRKFEYIIVYNVDSERILNNYGSEGWELAGIIYRPESKNFKEKFFFKREIVQEIKAP